METATERPDSKIIFELDLELLVRYGGPSSANPDLGSDHEFTIIRYTEESVRQKCVVCNRPGQAARRATIRNDTTGNEFHSGLDCLRDHFGVNLAELQSSSRQLKTLAVGWQDFCIAMGIEDSHHSTTKAAVIDMHEYFSRVPMLHHATKVIRDILDNVTQVQQGIFADEIDALLDFLGILFEVQNNRELLEDRRIAFGSHPRFTVSQQKLAERVLGNPEKLEWRDILLLSQAIKSIRSKKIKLLTKEAPPYNYPTAETYHQGLHERCQQIKDNVTHRDGLTPVSLFHKTIREAIEGLTKQGGGVSRFAFESTSSSSLDNLKPNHAISAPLKKKQGDLIVAEYFREYRHVESRRATSLSASQREGQLEDSARRSDEPIIHEGFYKTAVVFVPEEYLPCHQIWHKHGGLDNARRALEDLTSGFRSARSS